MPVETLRPQGAVPFTSAMPFRLLNKGPDYFRLRHQVEPGSRKLSAVERLEADKAKYVKSHQVALTRQSPVKPPIIRKPLLSPGMMFQCRITAPPARKVPRRPADAENGGRDGLGDRRGPALNLEILNNLINNVCDVGPLPPGSSPSPVPSSSPSPAPSSPSASSPSSGAKSVGSGLSEREAERSGRLLNNLRPCGTNTSSSTSSCTSSAPPPPPAAAALNNNNNNLQQSPPAEPCRRPPPVPARAPRGTAPPATPYGSSPNCVTVRRVDVRPQAELRRPQRAPLKPPLKPRPQALAQPQVAQPQAPPPPPPHQNLQPHVTTSHPPPPAFLPHSPMLLRAAAAVGVGVGIPPPASPAFTRLSNASSTRGSRTGGSARKQHPALHRSKSDLSDRYSRATADLERFFNYCGLDPREVEGLGGVERFTAGRANSDIVSVSKLRSVSTPSSECALAAAARGEGEGEEEDAGLAAANERVPYGISVIERNARVIKWLYGIRQARDVVTTSSGGVSNV